MPGDYTRLTFDPLLDRAMVLEQQGRVHLEADFNELAAILERRLRVETYDFAGHAVVPASLPHSFEIAWSGGPGSDLNIGPGRMYVDGLLAENHGYGKVIYEPVWDEPGYDGSTPIEHQPYQGSPITFTPSQTSQLAYLDVWQRERTAVEDSAIVEPALGVDTCTRVQTVWQVRLLESQSTGLTCDDWASDPAWLAATQPSSGRLSSAAVKLPAPADPCAVAPVGGYRGIENRLYRVEIHDGGPGGTATFKWSRDNGAVASPVTSVAGLATKPIITVERLGRDAVLRFHQNEWVELLDDTHELDGKPGLVGQVLDTDPSANTVTLAGPLAGTIDLTANPRLRRWDQQNDVNAGGVIPIPAGLPATFDLEDGVRVTLDLAAATGSSTPVFRTGDWWVFAARAASASVEELTSAPPRGVRHHYTRLAVIEGDTITSCRTVFPGDCTCTGDGCECTACVTPETHQDDAGPLTIQAAIDKVLPTGGRVCIAPGNYTLAQPLRIRGAHSLTLAGAGAATVITYRGEARVGILVEDSFEVSMERFALAVTGPDLQAAAGDVPQAAATAASYVGRYTPGVAGIALVNTVDSRVERCFVVVGVVPGDVKNAYFGTGDVGIGLAAWALRTRLIENVVLASTDIGDLTGGRSGLLKYEISGTGAAIEDPNSLQPTAEPVTYANLGGRGKAQYTATVDLAIVDNLLIALRAGIDFGSGMSALAAYAKGDQFAPMPTMMLLATRIADNLIVGGTMAGIVLLGLSAVGHYPAPKAGGGTAVGGTSVVGVVGSGPSDPCVQDTGGRQLIQWTKAGSPTGVTTGVSWGFQATGEVAVRGNVLLSTGDGIRVANAAVTIRENQIMGVARRSSRPTAGVLVPSTHGVLGGTVVVESNLIADFVLGGVIAAGPLDVLTVCANRIERLFGPAVANLAQYRRFLGTGGVTVAENRIGGISPAPGTGPPGAVHAVTIRNVPIARVTGNVIRNIAVNSTSNCIVVALLGCDTAEVAGNTLTAIGSRTEHTQWSQGIVATRFQAVDVRGNVVEFAEREGVSRDTPVVIGDPTTGQSALARLAFLSRAKSPVWGQFGGTVQTEFDPTPLLLPDASVHGNTLYAGGSEPVLLISAPVNALVAENRCRRVGSQPNSAIIHVETTGATIVSANRVENNGTDVSNPSIRLLIDNGAKLQPHCTVLGNIVNGEISLNDNPLGDPWAPLNINVKGQ